MSYINIEQYTKKIKDNVILDNISIQLEKNRIYGFVGINGSGKTMLFFNVSLLISIEFFVDVSRGTFIALSTR